VVARGAFAGRTPESSFRVDVDAKASLIDQGLFIVEIRIAPSMPMRFITVRLVQSSERMDVEEVTG
jgi:phage tail sheath protein FI